MLPQKIWLTRNMYMSLGYPLRPFNSILFSNQSTTWEATFQDHKGNAVISVLRHSGRQNTSFVVHFQF